MNRGFVQKIGPLFLCLGMFGVSIFLTSCGPREEQPKQVGSVRVEAQSLGAVGPLFLQSEPYDELLVEIAAAPGRAPSKADLAFLRRFLERRLNKPRGIHIVVDPPIDLIQKDALTREDIQGLEARYRKYRSSDKLLTVFYLFPDGISARDSFENPLRPQLTLAVAYEATSVAVFADALRLRAVMARNGVSLDALLTYSVLERFALTHEFGHLLGLVGVGPMTTPHADASEISAGGPKVPEYHCNNIHCLMYYRIDQDTLLQRNGVVEVPDLDAACQDDLRASGGK